MLRDLGRVVVAGGPVVITVSNRCFPTKAVEEWLRTDDRGRIGLVRGWLEASRAWGGVEVSDRSPSATSDPLHVVVARRLAAGGA